MLYTCEEVVAIAKSYGVILKQAQQIETESDIKARRILAEDLLANIRTYFERAPCEIRESLNHHLDNLSFLEKKCMEILEIK